MPKRPLVLAFALLLAACGGSATPAATPSGSSAQAPASATGKPSSAASAAVGSSNAAGAAAKPSASAASGASAAGNPSAVAGASAGAAPSGAMPKAKVGISAPSASQLPTMLAKDKGFYAQNGVDADVVSIFGGTATDALIAGQIQTLQISTKVIQADLAGADLVYIGAPVPTDRFWLFADPSISDVKALKGKRIGVTGVGTATYVSAKLVLAASGLDPNKDVTLASLTDESTILAAVQNGAVDAGMMAVSGMLKAQKAGLKELLDTSKLNVPFPSGWNAVSKKYAAAHPDVVRAYMRSIAQAVAFELQNPAQTEQQLGKFLKSDDAELMKATYEQGIAPIMQKNLALDLDAVKNALNDLSSSVPAAKTADPAAFIDDTYVKEMESSGFIASLYKS